MRDLERLFLSLILLLQQLSYLFGCSQEQTTPAQGPVQSRPRYLLVLAKAESGKSENPTSKVRELRVVLLVCGTKLAQKVIVRDSFDVAKQVQTPQVHRDVVEPDGRRLRAKSFFQDG